MGKTKDIDNRRATSTLSVLSTLLEWAVHDQRYHFLGEMKLLTLSNVAFVGAIPLNLLSSLLLTLFRVFAK